MSRARTFALFIPIVIVMGIIDFIAKSWALGNLHTGEIGIKLGLVDLTLVRNTGAAFGMGQGQGMLFVLLALVICVTIIAWLLFAGQHTALEVVALALIVAGGIGNCIDRLNLGYVVDFIRLTFIDFPVFNVADICVTCGVVLFIIAMLSDGILSNKTKNGCASDD